MTIGELMYKYTSHLNPNKILQINTSVESGYDLDQYNHILLNHLPDNTIPRIEKILDILTHNYSGLTIYFNESGEDITNRIGRIFESKYKTEQLKQRYGIGGLTIQHITDIGYIISTTDIFKSCMINNYSLDEYEKHRQDYIIVAIAKQEAHYIKDWVAYHLRIGVDRIYIYDNNDMDGERYDGILNEYIQSGQVVLIDIRGKSCMQNQIYNASYHAIPFKWMIVIDVDEFLWFNETGHYIDIQNFLGDIGGCCGEDRYGVLLQWHCYAPSGEDHPANKPIWEVNDKLIDFNARKDSRPEYIHEWCKSIYKPGYRISINEHFAWLCGSSNEVMMVNWDGESFTKENLSRVSEDEFINQPVYIKHFLLRNIDDFFQKKYKRGHAGADFGKGQDGWRYWQWYQNMNYYTDIVDNITPKEQDYMMRHGMKVNYTFHPDVFIILYTLDGNIYINESINRILCDHILPNTNTFLTHIHISNPLHINQEYDPNELPQKRFNNDLTFMSKQLYTDYYHDLFINDDLSCVRKFKQEPIVINIGIPPKFAYSNVTLDEQKGYIDILDVVFNWKSLRDLLRETLENNLTIIPQFGYETKLYEDMCQDLEFIKYMELNKLCLSPHLMCNNTVIMSFMEFQKYRETIYNFIKDFGCIDNKSIYINEQNGAPTRYHKLISSISSIFEKPYFVWKV